LTPTYIHDILYVLIIKGGYLQRKIYTNLNYYVIILMLLSKERNLIMSVISGEAYWAHIITPNTKFNPDGEWSIEVCNLNAKNKKIAEGDGLTIKNKGDERGDFVTLKQYARTRDGSTRSISVKDSERNPFPSSKRVGNGSKVNASYRPVPYTQYGGGVKGYLNAVQVVDLIEYNADDFDVVKGGYVNEDTDDLAFAS
jgi:hypothetical protein